MVYWHNKSSRRGLRPTAANITEGDTSMTTSVLYHDYRAGIPYDLPSLLCANFGGSNLFPGDFGP